MNKCHRSTPLSLPGQIESGAGCKVIAMNITFDLIVPSEKNDFKMNKYINHIPKYSV